MQITYKNTKYKVLDIPEYMKWYLYNQWYLELITKPEEKPTKEEKRIMEACKPYVRGTGEINHEKAMDEIHWYEEKIEEVPEFHPDFLLWEDAVTNSLNQVIKRLNK